MKKIVLGICLILYAFTGYSIEKGLEATGATGRWVKIARIQNREPIDGAEYSQFSGTLNIQTDFGRTGSEQYYAIFSFGSRGGIRPLLFEMGDAARRSTTNTNRIEWRIYKAPDGYHYLWMWQSNYCRYAVFNYQATGSLESWTYENPPVDYQLVWDSKTGDRQSFTAPIKDPVIEGKMGIGISNPKHELEVNGTIRAKEIKVDTDWADFVFEDNYQLMKLSELEEFIKKNGHLPDIPSEQKVKTEGISLGEMNSKLLQKIEEQTLYILQLQKQLQVFNLRLEKIEKSE